MQLATNRKGNRERKKPQRITPVRVSSAAKALSVLTVTFDQVVILKGVPQYAVVGAVGATPLSAVQTAPNVVAITYTASIAAATAVNVPFQDPAVRNEQGGFVATSTFALT